MAFWQTSMAESFSSAHPGDFKAEGQRSAGTGHSVYVEQVPPCLPLRTFPVKRPVIANVVNKLLE